MPRRGPKGFRDRLAERDPEILDGVVLIDVEIAGGGDPEIVCAVPRDQLQHVIEEADARAHLIRAAPVEARRSSICVSVVRRSITARRTKPLP